MEETKRTVDDGLSTIHYLLKEMFPEAVSVSVFVSSEGISATPVFKINVSGCSMKNISGKWVE